MAKQVLIGLRGHAIVIQIYAAVTNSDTQGGMGHNVDHSYYETARGALLGSIGIGVMGNDGTVEPRPAVKFDDGTILLLTSTSIITLGDEEKLAQDARTTALAKLTLAERSALNIEQQSETG